MMSAHRIPGAVRARLGDEATFGLLELLADERKDWSEQVLTMASERFERRLAQELAALRTEFANTLNEGLTAVRQEIAASRVDMLRWSFVFWIGQVAAVAGLFALLVRR